MKSQKKKQEIMGIAGLLIKSIKVKNYQKRPKEVYIVVSVDQNHWVGKVTKLESGEKSSFQQLLNQFIFSEESQEIQIGIWDYDLTKEIKRIQLVTCRTQNPILLKIPQQNLQIQLIFQLKTVGSNRPNFRQESSKNPKFSLPSLKKSYSKRNSLKFQPQTLCSTSAVQYNSQNQSRNSLVNCQRNTQNETSLEKIINKNQKPNDYDSQELYRKKQAENKNFKSSANLKALFDDYESKAKEIKKICQLREEKPNEGLFKDQILSSFNTSTQSSFIQKNLKKTISQLSKKTLKNSNSKKLLHQIETKPISLMQILQYGLGQNKKTMENKSLLKDEKIQPRRKPQKLPLFYERHLIKKEAEKMQHMESFETSKSIFEHYGLDLQEKKLQSSKSLQRSLNQRKQQNLKRESSIEVRRVSIKLKERVKNANFLANDKQFEDYGEFSQVKRTSNSKSLRRTERPQ